jgi:predicted nucleic acid-binding protein
MSGKATFTFDTNILFYASDSSAGQKHRRALALMDMALNRDCLLTLQSLGELYNAIAKRRAISAAETRAIILAYRETFPVIAATEADLVQAMQTHLHDGLHFWDAMLWATARRAGCTLLLSEDLQDGRVLGGVTIRNPFAPGFDLDAI